MKINVFVIANTNLPYLKDGVKIYCDKLKHYFPFEYVEIPDLKQTKNLSFEEISQKEGVLILKKITPDQFVILLDECGKTFSSIDFSNFLQQKMTQNIKTLSFVIGGAYGFSEEIYARADFLLSLSPMTFSHQMVRLIFLEQLYRAASIWKNEPYHHQ